MKLLIGLLVLCSVLYLSDAGKKKVHIKIIVPKLIKNHKHTKYVYIHKKDKKHDDHHHDDHHHDDHKHHHDEHKHHHDDHHHDDHKHKHKHDKKTQHHLVHHYHYHSAKHDHKGSHKHHHDLKHDHKHKGGLDHKHKGGIDHKVKGGHEHKHKHSHDQKKKKKDDHGHHGGGHHDDHHGHKYIYLDGKSDDHNSDDHGDGEEYGNYEEDHSREDDGKKGNYYYFNHDVVPLEGFTDGNDKISHKSHKSEFVEVSNYGGNPNYVLVNNKKYPGKLVTVTSGYQVQENQPFDQTTRPYEHYKLYDDSSENLEEDEDDSGSNENQNYEHYTQRYLNYDKTHDSETQRESGDSEDDLPKFEHFGSQANDLGGDFVSHSFNKRDLQKA